MRYVSLLLVVVLLLLSVAVVQAYWRPIIRDFDGDPDEFQATNVHNETGSRGGLLPRRVRLDEPEKGEPSKPRAFPEVRDRQCFSFSFSGRKFFLEK